MSKLHCGIIDDSPEFHEWLKSFFKTHKNSIKDHDKWWLRDWLSDAWNEAIDTCFNQIEEYFEEHDKISVSMDQMFGPYDKPDLEHEGILLATKVHKKKIKAASTIVVRKSWDVVRRVAAKAPKWACRSEKKKINKDIVNCPKCDEMVEKGRQAAFKEIRDGLNTPCGHLWSKYQDKFPISCSQWLRETIGDDKNEF